MKRKEGKKRERKGRKAKERGSKEGKMQRVPEIPARNAAAALSSDVRGTSTAAGAGAAG